MLVEIFNGVGKIYDNRFYLHENGYQFNKRSYGKSFYSKKTDSEKELQEIQEFCNQKGLTIRKTEERYIRSSNYRKAYMDSQHFKGAVTLCGYCGLPVRVKDLTVDHIIPVDKAHKSNCAKWLLQNLHIDDVNDVRKLTGACRRCNSRKRAKMGVWVLLGFLGKIWWLWCFRWAVRVIVLIAVVRIGLAYFV